MKLCITDDAKAYLASKKQKDITVDYFVPAASCVAGVVRDPRVSLGKPKAAGAYKKYEIEDGITVHFNRVVSLPEDPDAVVEIIHEKTLFVHQLMVKGLSSWDDSHDQLMDEA